MFLKKKQTPEIVLLAISNNYYDLCFVRKDLIADALGVKRITAEIIPPHVARVYIENRLKEGVTCPISQEALTEESACITSCGHLFEKQMIVKWLNGGNNCPVCKHECTAMM